MAKKVKESKPFSIRMDKAVFERMEAFCVSSGQSKTLAIERAITKYIDEYDRNQELIKKESEE